MASTGKKYDFSGKVALVTGSSSGIGAAIATQYAVYGAKVAITGRNAANLDKIAQQIAQVSGGEKPLQIIGDLQNDAAFPKKLIDDTIAKYGRLDILVNNAGGMTPLGTLASPNLMQEYDDVFKLNVRSIVALTQLAVPHLEKTKGNIINLSSIAALKPMTLVYCASKAAVQMVTQCVALELGPKGIRCNSINPGYIMTNLGRSAGLTDPAVASHVYGELGKKMLLKRLGQPDDIANLASFLASDLAVNITGSSYLSDSGFMLAPADYNDDNFDAGQAKNETTTAPPPPPAKAPLKEVETAKGVHCKITNFFKR